MSQRDVIVILEDVITHLQSLITLQGGGDTTALLTAIKNATDGLEALITSTNGYVDGLEGSVDGLETLLGDVKTKLDTLHTDLIALKDPTTYTAITPNDSTDVTSVCTKGLFVSVTGDVNVTGVGGSAVSLGTQIAGTTIPGALSRVNAATTATVFGLSGP